MIFKAFNKVCHLIKSFNYNHVLQILCHCLVCLSFELADTKRVPSSSSFLEESTGGLISCSRLLCNLNSYKVRLNHCTLRKE